MKRLFPIAAAIVATSCTNGPEPDSPRFAVETASGLPVVVRSSSERVMTMDAASAVGAFDLADGCLILTVDGVPRTPVFPARPEVDVEARRIAIGGSEIGFGEPIGLEGASGGDEPPPGLTGGERLPAACPERFFHFGGVSGLENFVPPPE